MKVLVTGATGFAGSHLIDLLSLDNNTSIVGTSLDKSYKDKNVEIVKVDLLNFDKVFDLISKIKPDQIYHLAALSSPSLSFDAPSVTITNNTNAQINIFEALLKNNLTNTHVLIIS